MEIYGINKLTLLDFPNLTACTIFTGGCNFRCPFCHNAELVYCYGKPAINSEEFFAFLDKRKNVLDGVCITGGEPTLNNDLPLFIKEIKNYGYKVKLDTNGSNFDMLENVVLSKLVDYVAMDIKSCIENYGEAAGIENFDITSVKKSAAFLIDCGIEYEFRTTVVKELHNEECFEKIGKWLKGAKAFYLQQFNDKNILSEKNFSPCSLEEMTKYRGILASFVKKSGLRGI